MDSNEIATKSDVEEILRAIEKLHNSLVQTGTEKMYLRSADVRKLLSISDSTLQRLRITNTLIAKKINGTWFYKNEDVIKMLNSKP